RLAREDARAVAELALDARDAVRVFRAQLDREGVGGARPGLPARRREHVEARPLGRERPGVLAALVLVAGEVAGLQREHVAPVTERAEGLRGQRARSAGGERELARAELEGTSVRER